jgi:hypothetical protein
MSKNIDQIYIANPSISLPPNALMYAGLYPFGITDDTAITVGNFLAQIPSATGTDVIVPTQALVPNNVYVTNNGSSLVTYSLPLVAPEFSVIEIVGKSLGGWSILQNAGQNIQFGNKSTTVGTGGDISSTNQFDYVKLICITANTTLSVIGSIGNLTIV